MKVSNKPDATESRNYSPDAAVEAVERLAVSGEQNTFLPTKAKCTRVVQPACKQLSRPDDAWRMKL